jgi:hypothetical protein
MQAPFESMIHIVGLYKCGTTWLLRALAAHPGVIAFREFDLIAATSEAPRRPAALAAAARDYLWRRPQDEAWMARREVRLPRTPQECFRELFLGRGWMPVMGEALQQRAAALPTQDLHALLDELLALTDLSVRADGAAALDAAAVGQPLGVRALRHGALLALMQSVRDATTADAVPALFYRALAGQVEPGTRIACKAADQVMHLDALRRATPGATLIAVVRDGRDAAVSAQHFESLMRRQQAPWRVAQRGTAKRLVSWAVRAAKLAEHARRGEVLVLRYEDLQRDFAGTLGALLARLALDSAPERVADIETQTSFRASSGGRERGEAAIHIVRRGIVGEWREAFTPLQKALAWRLVGRELEAFGYGERGELTPSPLLFDA